MECGYRLGWEAAPYVVEPESESGREQARCSLRLPSLLYNTGGWTKKPPSPNRSIQSKAFQIGRKKNPPVKPAACDHSKPVPRRDDDDHNPHKDEWNDAADFFDDLSRHLAAKQAVLRAEYIAKGCIDLAADQVARRSRLSHQVYLEAKAAAADHHGDFVEKLNRDKEDDGE
ncbi:uncharacterized protein [Triticum aestivum]|uniref:uncharacterized protein n=1 Tax=Triticum aestivum TaxID=4565 RepID=UPI001D00768F|nr:uncharacterized protein LOC123097202 [Triticum aestivum]